MKHSISLDSAMVVFSNFKYFKNCNLFQRGDEGYYNVFDKVDHVRFVTFSNRGEADSFL